jgi:hypothetical protein
VLCEEPKASHCAVPSGTRLEDVSLPGTDVPGYRLCRPYGTVSLQVELLIALGLFRCGRNCFIPMGLLGWDCQFCGAGFAGAGGAGSAGLGTG